jgi:hypothetical protein
VDPVPPSRYPAIIQKYKNLKKTIRKKIKRGGFRKETERGRFRKKKLKGDDFE